jgi:hypothetical protein
MTRSIRPKALRPRSWQIPVGSAALVAWSVGCGVDYGYAADDYARKTAPLPANAVVVDVLDGRPVDPLASPEDGAEALEEVRASVHEHLLLAGVVSARGDLAPAPRTPAEIESLLAKAASAGAPEVLFLSWRVAAVRGNLVSLAAFGYLIGLIPWLIVDSLPLSRHGASAVFAAFTVDPKTREVLHQATPLGT